MSVTQTPISTPRGAESTSPSVCEPIMRSRVEPPNANQRWRVCRAYVREHARTFYFGSFFLSPARRQASYAAYAYCRIADDLVDRAVIGGPDAAREALTAWADELDAPRHPVAVAFAEVRERYRIPDQAIQDLIIGVGMDLAPERYPSWPDLRHYCYHVAGTVGLISAPIFGCHEERALRHAVDLGIAMQLTNVLRDVAEDATMGRLYLPLDDLERFGVDPDSVLAGHPNGDFSGLLAFEIERAHELYRSARQGIPALCPSGRLTTIAISRLYSQILNRIEAQRYDVFGRRAHVPTTGKLIAMPTITADFLRLQLGASFWS